MLFRSLKVVPPSPSEGAIIPGQQGLLPETQRLLADLAEFSLAASFEPVGSGIAATTADTSPALFDSALVSTRIAWRRDAQRLVADLAA